MLDVHSFHVCGKGSSSLVVSRVHTCTKKLNEKVLHYATHDAQIKSLTKNYCVYATTCMCCACACACACEE